MHWLYSMCASPLLTCCAVSSYAIPKTYPKCPDPTSPQRSPVAHPEPLQACSQVSMNFQNFCRIWKSMRAQWYGTGYGGKEKEDKISQRSIIVEKRGEKKILFKRSTSQWCKEIQVCYGERRRVMESTKAWASPRATKKRRGKQATTPEKEMRAQQKAHALKIENLQEKAYLMLENFPKTGRQRGRNWKGSRRRSGTRRTKEENLSRSKNLGIAILVILEKQENHLPTLKCKVKKEFLAYSTQ